MTFSTKSSLKVLKSTKLQVYNERIIDGTSYSERKLRQQRRKMTGAAEIRKSAAWYIQYSYEAISREIASTRC